jgi:hypothetical protein
MHIIGVHNARSGGSTRKRLLEFTNDCIDALSAKHTIVYKWYLKMIFWMKLIMFEKMFWLYKFLYGFLEIKFDDQNKMVLEV